MARALLITVRFHNGRYHGLMSGERSEWPPSPARMFQALVSGTARKSLDASAIKALEWLEKQNAPLIASPITTRGQEFEDYLPNNNDPDAAGRWLLRIGKGYRGEKKYRPRIFDPAIPLLYAWTCEPGEESERNAATVAAIAEQVYQLGRGVDMAWAFGELLDSAALEARLAAYPGMIHSPNNRSDVYALDCPEPGSLESVLCRYRQGGGGMHPTRHRESSRGRETAPRPRFRSIAYNSPASHLLFDLRDTAKADAPFAPWPLARVVELVQVLRGRLREDGSPDSGADSAAKRLWNALPDRHGEIASVLIGRNATDADKHRRVRILPFPSIGHAYVSRAIRRVLVEVPPNCPLPVDDLAWAFSGLEVTPVSVDEDTGEILSRIQLVPADERSILKHYGVGASDPACVWRSVTPLALPEGAKRRRIEPKRQREEAKKGSERLSEQRLAAGAVLQALRHADVHVPVTQVLVQREPFEAKGSRVEAFAPGTRFTKERLWHAEITFTTPRNGLLILGDGRYAGLGLMAPARPSMDGVFAYSIVGGLAEETGPAVISAALRRAVMARVQDAIGDRKYLPTFFTGHERDGAAARDNTHRHLAFVTDLVRGRLLIVAPHVLERRLPTPDERTLLGTLAASLTGFSELRAGAAGKLELAATAGAVDDPLFAVGMRWQSITDFRMTRHPKKTETREALVADVVAELTRRNIPRPTSIKVLQCFAGPRGGVSGRIHMEFATAVRGPILIGRTCHSGGGLFACG